jgi:hypothetical protein
MNNREDFRENEDGPMDLRLNSVTFRRALRIFSGNEDSINTQNLQGSTAILTTCEYCFWVSSCFSTEPLATQKQDMATIVIVFKSVKLIILSTFLVLEAM